MSFKKTTWWNGPLEEEIDSSSGKKPDQEWISNSKSIRACIYSFGWVNGTEEKNESNLLFPKQPSRVLNYNAFVSESGWSWIKCDSSFPSVFNGSCAWNPTAEDQRFYRCRMLGQKQSAVNTKDAVEENILKIQNKKRKLAAGAFATKKPSASEI